MTGPIVQQANKPTKRQLVEGDHLRLEWLKMWVDGQSPVYRLCLGRPVDADSMKDMLALSPGEAKELKSLLGKILPD